MKTRYKLKYFLTILLAVYVCATLVSCQKVIDVDLNSTEPRIVIEGAISDQIGPYAVKITQTSDFKETNVFPRVVGALVVISDDLGNTEILNETSPGFYTTTTLQGVPGRTYTLSVKVNRNEYKAVSTMPLPVEITGLGIRRSDFGVGKVVDVIFEDATDFENYYKFIQIINGVDQREIDIFDDEFNEGSKITYTLFTDDEEELQPGDSVIVMLQTIDKAVYEFYRTAGEAIGGSQSPANPNTNLSNGALGYFSAYSVRSDTIIVE